MKTFDTTELAVKAELLKQDNKQAFNIGNLLTMVGMTALMISSPAEAATFKDTMVNIYTLIVGPVGVIGAILVVVAGVNWAGNNFIGVQDAKKFFFQVLFGTIIALSAVSIIVAIKGWAGADDAITTL